MKIAKTLYVSNRRSWRAWLKRNYATRKEIWLIYYKKDSGKPRIPYEDAVEEALCFGWIDSTVKKFDAERYLQKFTPRNPGSIWAASNVQRAKKEDTRRRRIQRVVEMCRQGRKPGML
jgi:uncharacterized protein YdeI (YjbR/CyaY-like superfamily)